MNACSHCRQRPAVACQPCELSFMHLDGRHGFDSYARHPEEGSDCRLCEAGAAEFCVDCLCRDVLRCRAIPGGPDAGPTLAKFAEQEREMVAQPWYDRRRAHKGPSWYRRIPSRSAR